MSRGGRSASLSPTPKSRSHGRCYSPRRFSSRHVPAAAEELAAHSQVLEATVIKRFDGLMKHLKRNTDKQDFEKQVLASPPEVLVPEEFDEVLRGEFARHCNYGERLNSELMHSGKWMKMLKEHGFIPTAESQSPRKGEVKEPCQPCLPARADADIIFQRVLHDTDYGGKRLTYDFFCKALCLVAAKTYPNLDWEAAMGELLNRIAASAQDPLELADQMDFSLDPNVLLVLDHFKPKLHDLFRSFARRQLRGPTDAKVGSGTTRLKERTIWKQTQETMFASKASKATSRTSTTLAKEETLNPEPEDFSVLPAVKESDEDGRDKMEKLREETEDTEPEMLPHHVGSPPPSPKRTLLPSAALEFDLKGSKTGMSPKSPAWMAWAESLGLLGTTTGSRKSISSRSGQWAEMDPYTYACGSPTIRNSQNFLSLEQLFSLCKELSIMPEVISRQAVVRIFKRAQCAGSTTAHAGSNFGYLTQEAFVDAMGRIGIQAYSEAPYCDEYPEAHEKIHAFLLDRLPGQVRAMRDSFLYGCSGRGKTVQPGYMAK